MTRFWFFSGTISLLVAIGIFLDQKMRFSIWWEWEDFFHHETFTGILACIAVVFLVMALIERKKNRL